MKSIKDDLKDIGRSKMDEYRALQEELKEVFRDWAGYCQNVCLSADKDYHQW
jgi:hypothetical protein